LPARRKGRDLRIVDAPSFCRQALELEDESATPAGGDCAECEALQARGAQLEHAAWHAAGLLLREAHLTRPSLYISLREIYDEARIDFEIGRLEFEKHLRMHHSSTVGSGWIM
jgi:hypothetical protein